MLFKSKKPAIMEVSVLLDFSFGKTLKKLTFFDYLLS